MDRTEKHRRLARQEKAQRLIAEDKRPQYEISAWLLTSPSSVSLWASGDLPSYFMAERIIGKYADRPKVKAAKS